jgi:hypothetical protein
MQIVDLSYLEGISVSSSLTGGALAAVTADASATGNPTLTLTDTTTKARELGNGGSIAFGRGKAVAVGEAPVANVNVYGEGDRVIGKTKTRYFKRFDTMIATGFVIAIDRP